MHLPIAWKERVFNSFFLIGVLFILTFLSSTNLQAQTDNEYTGGDITQGTSYSLGHVATLGERLVVNTVDFDLTSSLALSVDDILVNSGRTFTIDSNATATFGNLSGSGTATLDGTIHIRGLAGAGDYNWSVSNLNLVSASVTYNASDNVNISSSAFSSTNTTTWGDGTGSINLGSGLSLTSATDSTTFDLENVQFGTSSYSITNGANMRFVGAIDYTNATVNVDGSGSTFTTEGGTASNLSTATTTNSGVFKIKNSTLENWSLGLTYNYEGDIGFADSGATAFNFNGTNTSFTNATAWNLEAGGIYNFSNNFSLPTNFTISSQTNDMTSETVTTLGATSSTIFDGTKYTVIGGVTDSPFVEWRGTVDFYPGNMTFYGTIKASGDQLFNGTAQAGDIVTFKSGSDMDVFAGGSLEFRDIDSGVTFEPGVNPLVIDGDYLSDNTTVDGGDWTVTATGSYNLTDALTINADLTMNSGSTGTWTNSTFQDSTLDIGGTIDIGGTTTKIKDSDWTLQVGASYNIGSNEKLYVELTTDHTSTVNGDIIINTPTSSLGEMILNSDFIGVNAWTGTGNITLLGANSDINLNAHEWEVGPGITLQGRGDVRTGIGGKLTLYGTFLGNDSAGTFHFYGDNNPVTIDLDNQGVMRAIESVQINSADVTGGASSDGILDSESLLESASNGVLIMASSNIQNNDFRVGGTNGQIKTTGTTTITNGDIFWDAANVATFIVTGTTTFSDVNLVMPSSGNKLEIQNGARLILDGDHNLSFAGAIDMVPFTSSGAYLELRGNETFGGTGEIFLGGTGSGLGWSRIEGDGVDDDGTTNFRRINIGSNFTVHGAGYLGNNEILINNAGIIDADQNGKILTVDARSLTASNVINTGVMKSTNGATLFINGTTVDNTSGDIQAEAGSFLTVTGSTVTNGNMSTVSNGQIDFNSTANTLTSVNLTNSATGIINVNNQTTFNNVSFMNPSGGVFDINNGSRLILDGNHSWDFDGNITLTPFTTSGAYFDIRGAFVFGGTSTGKILLDGTGSGLGWSRIEGDGQVHDGTSTFRSFTQTASHSVEGSGYIGNNELYIDNAGNIIANDSGKVLWLDGRSASGTNVVNTGNIISESGGQLVVNGSVVDNTGGVIEVRDGSIVYVRGSQVSNGNMNVVDTGVLTLDQTTSTLKDLTLTNNATGTVNISNTITFDNVSLTHPAGGDFNINLGSRLILDGDHAWNIDGDIDFNSTTSSGAVLELRGAFDLTGTGNLMFKGPNYSNLRIEGDGQVHDGNTIFRSINIGANNSLQGAGQLGFNELYVENAGDVLANVSGQFLTVDGRSGTPFNVKNTGNMISESGGGLIFNGSTVDNTSGVIEVRDASTLYIRGSEVTNGNINIVDSGVLNMDISPSTLHDLTLTNSTNGTANVSTTITFDNVSLTNPSGGNLNINTGAHLILDGDHAWNMDGDITLKSTTSSGSYLELRGALGLSGTGDIVLNGPNYNNIRIEGDGAVHDGSTTFRSITIGANNTVSGAGQLGFNELYVVNNGNVVADRSGLALAVDGNASSGDPIVNNGAFSATNNGQLWIQDNVTGTGSWTADGGEIRINNGADITTTGDILVDNGGALNLVAHASVASITGNDLTIQNGSSLSVNSTVSLSGDFSYDTTVATDFGLDNATSVLEMTGGTGLTNLDVNIWPTLEVGGTDFGNTPYVAGGANATGFTDNFSITTLTIGADAHIKLVDAFNNSTAGGLGDEILYVDTLNFSDSNARLYVNGLKLYFNSSNLSGSALTDALLQNVFNTPSGTNVQVDLGNGLVVTFDTVTADGNTVDGTGSIPDPGAVTDDFLAQDFIGKLLSDSLIEVSTSATFDSAGNAGYQIELTYNQTTFDNELAPFGFTEEELRLFHRISPGVFEDITIELDTVNNTITGFAQSFSEFGVGVNPEPATLILLGSGLLALLPGKKRLFRR